ncbi:MAG: YncE family protein [Acidobacteria bacterium]|nr:YncE family protein [Acidobacteriota bacterium]
MTSSLRGLVLVSTVVCASPAAAQIVVSANDNTLVLVDGVQTTVRNPAPDTVTVLELSGGRLKTIGEVQAPVSVVGPPSSAAITPDRSMAIVTSATKVDPANPSATVPDDTVSVIDIKASPVKVIATLKAGAGASGVAINPAGTLALVANRIAGTVSVFRIDGARVTPAGTVDLGAPASGPSGIAFTPDGRTALVTRNNDSLISILAVNGVEVSYTKRDVGAGFRPYQIAVTKAGDVAVVGNTGAGQAGGGVDVVNAIDLAAAGGPRTVAHAVAGPTVESVALSPDGKYVAAMVMNGSSAPKASPAFNDFGLLKVFALAKGSLTPAAEARIGHWCQGIVWSADAKTVVVGCMVEKELQVFAFDGSRLTPAQQVKVSGGSAALAATY